MYWIKRKIWQIKNVFKWLPIIWNQYDFDYSYALEVFRFQLSKIADYLESESACTKNSKYNAQRIRLVLKLMNKIDEGDYAYEFLEKIRKSYGPDALDINKYMKYKYEEWPNSDKIHKEYSEGFIESYKKDEKANELVWKILSRNIKNWWD